MAKINLEPAHAVAKAEFAEKVPEEMARNSMVVYEPERKRFIVPFLRQDYYIHFPDGSVEMVGKKEEVDQTVQILLLHYLTHASPGQVQDKLISFKELPGGMIYVEPFTNRAIRPLVGIFGNNPSKLVEAGESLGGKRRNMGDAAVTVPVLPKIPITFVIWEGDDEFPPAGNVLFDSSAPFHLDTEDYALLPGLVLSEMKKKI